MRDALITIAAALDYDKLPRLQRDLPNYSHDFIVQALNASMNHTNNILFFPGKFYEIGIFGVKFYHFFAKGINPDNYILSFPMLDKKFLRRLFTGIELVVFKLCHLTIEDHRRNYHFRNGAASAKGKKITANLVR
jgi:hypothetical protein